MPLAILCLGLVALGVYLVARSLSRLHKLDARIQVMNEKLKQLPGWVQE